MDTSVVPGALLTWPEVHAAVRRSRTQVFRDERQKKFPTRIRQGGRVYWRRDEIASYLKRLAEARHE